VAPAQGTFFTDLFARQAFSPTFTP
jgi:hypothetical protein